MLVDCILLLCSGGGSPLDPLIGAISFAIDPLGALYQSMQQAAKGLLDGLLPIVVEATLPDLTAEWFINAYAISFALAFLGMIVLLIPIFLGVARGRIAGRELVESLTLYVPVFIIGAAFGPMLGMVLVNFFHALSEDFIRWGFQGSSDKVNERVESMQWLSELLGRITPTSMPGGTMVALILMFLMVLALLVVTLVLIVQLVMLYVTGVLAPMSLVWILNPHTRHMGVWLVQRWVVVLATHPLLFFLLGLAFTMMSSIFNGELAGQQPAQLFVSFCVALLAIGLAAIAPWLLLRFAPVLPGIGGAAPSLSSTTTPVGPSSLTQAAERAAAPTRGGGTTGAGAPTAATASSQGGRSLSAAAATNGATAGARSASGAGAGATGAGAGAAGAAGAGAAVPVAGAVIGAGMLAKAAADRTGEAVEQMVDETTAPMEGGDA